MSVDLTDEERLAISAVVHQNYYMPDVFAAVEKIVAARMEPVEQVVARMEHDISFGQRLLGMRPGNRLLIVSIESRERDTTDLRAALTGTAETSQP